MIWVKCVSVRSTVVDVYEEEEEGEEEKLKFYDRSSTI